MERRFSTSLKLFHHFFLSLSPPFIQPKARQTHTHGNIYLYTEREIRWVWAKVSTRIIIMSVWMTMKFHFLDFDSTPQMKSLLVSIYEGSLIRNPSASSSSNRLTFTNTILGIFQVCFLLYLLLFLDLLLFILNFKVLESFFAKWNQYHGIKNRAFI